MQYARSVGSNGDRDADSGAARTVSRARRLNDLREQLVLRPRSVVELAKAHGTSRRSIERDLRTLDEEMGVDLRTDGRGRWFVPARPSALNEVEALAVYSATRLLLHIGVGERHYRAALEKLSLQVPEPARSVLLRSVAGLASAPEDRVLDLVAQAWFQRRVLGCDYYSAYSGDTKPRRLEIYFYELNRRNLEPYVLAFDRNGRQRVLVFKLARMRNVRLLDDGYEIPADFDPVAHLDGSFGILAGRQVEVVVRASPKVAARMTESGDRNVQVGEALTGGDRVVRVTGTLDSEGRAMELLPWLLGWGGAIEVISPVEVRDQVRAELAGALANYDA